MDVPVASWNKSDTKHGKKHGKSMWNFVEQCYGGNEWALGLLWDKV